MLIYHSMSVWVARPSGSSANHSFVADCLAGDVVGNFVYITGDLVGGVKQVSSVDVTDPSKMPTVGVIVAKPTSTSCVVQQSGSLDTTTFKTLTPNSRYWIGFDAKLRDTLPIPGSGVSVAQQVGVALSSSELMLHFKQAFKLDR